MKTHLESFRTQTVALAILLSLLSTKITLYNNIRIYIAQNNLSISIYVPYGRFTHNLLHNCMFISVCSSIDTIGLCLLVWIVI